MPRGSATRPRPLKHFVTIIPPIYLDKTLTKNTRRLSYIQLFYCSPAKKSEQEVLPFFLAHN